MLRTHKVMRSPECFTFAGVVRHLGDEIAQNIIVLSQDDWGSNTVQDDEQVFLLLLFNPYDANALQECTPVFVLFCLF